MNIDRLQQNLTDVRSRMHAACGRARRDPASVTLVAVTKTVTADVVRSLSNLGVLVFGENRIQEAGRKRAALPDLPIALHMIGHLQSNKAKEAVQLFDMIHSVDSVHLAEALDRRAAAERRVMPILIQVNVSGEQTKSGFDAASAVDGVRRIAGLPALQIKGLMTMAPISDDPEAVRPVFARLRRLCDDIAALCIPRVEMTHLSMGMSQDFEVAIEEGATLIRVGTALFAGI